MFLWLRRVVHQWTEDEPHLKRAAPIFDVPVAAALVLSFLVMGGRYAGAPGFVHAAVSILALLPTVVLLRRLLAPRLYVVLWALADVHGAGSGPRGDFHAADAGPLAVLLRDGGGGGSFPVSVAAAAAADR